MAIVRCEANLLELIDTFGPPGSSTRRLHGGQQQSDQDSNDRDHN